MNVSSKAQIQYYELLMLIFTGERLGGCDEGSEDGSVVLRRRDRLVPEPGNRDSNSTIICEIWTGKLLLECELDPRKA